MTEDTWIAGEQSDLFHALLDAAPDGIVGIDERGKIVLFNRQAQTMFGYKPGEVLGSGIGMLIPDRYRETHKTHIATFFEKPSYRTMGGANTQLFGLKKNGEEFPVDISLSMISSREGKISISAIRDITERKKAEKLLEQSETKYRNLIESSQELIQLVSKSGKVIFANKWWQKTLGYNEKDLEHLNIFEVIAPECVDYCIDKFSHLLGGEDISHLETTFKTKSGNVLYVEGHAIPVVEDGEIVGTQGFFRDVTTRKIAEDALKKSEANLRGIFDNTDLAFVLVDTDLNIVSFNRVASAWIKELFGQELREGISPGQVLYEQERQLLNVLMEQGLQGEHVSYEANYTAENGTTKWFLVMVNAIKDNQQTIGLCLAVSDITERKNAEIELQEITSDVAQRNKDLEQFAYIVSHNLRSPVANILGLSEMLKDVDIDKKDMDYALSSLHNSVKMLDNIINDLNYVLQIKKNITEKREFVNLDTLVSDIKTSIGTLLKSEQVEINADFSEINMLFIIRSYLHSIFYNLISNSIKYRKPNEPPIINIKSERHGNKVEIIFSDNGLGIDMVKNGKNIFGLYKRFHKVSEGKGVGLFMIKTQVEAMEGKISLESEPNKGTTFTIVLPLTDKY